MSADPERPEWLLSKLGEAFSSVRLKGGVVARTSHAMFVLIVVWGLVVWRWTADPWIDSGLLLVGVVVSSVFLIWNKSIQKFAERNPAQAMLEGAEFLEYRKFEAQAKSGNAGSPAIIVDPTAPKISSPDRGEPDVS